MWGFLPISGLGGADHLCPTTGAVSMRSARQSWVQPHQDSFLAFLVYVYKILLAVIAFDYIQVFTILYLMTYFQLLSMVLNLQLSAQAQGCIYIKLQGHGCVRAS